MVFAFFSEYLPKETTKTFRLYTSEGARLRSYKTAAEYMMQDSKYTQVPFLPKQNNKCNGLFYNSFHQSGLSSGRHQPPLPLPGREGELCGEAEPRRDLQRDQVEVGQKRARL